MHTSVVNRVDQLPPAWDRLGHDPLSSRTMLGVLERSHLPGVTTRYALLFEGTRLVAGAPVATVDIDGERLTHGAFRSLIITVRRFQPGFLHTRLMVCGTPLSVANPPIRVRATERNAVLPVLSTVMDQLAREAHAPWCVFKELSRSDVSVTARGLSSRWLLAPSEPTAMLRMVWPTFDAYLRSLRSDYRHRIRKAQRKLQAGSVDIEVSPLAGAYHAFDHALYEAVFDRAHVQFEHLTPAFFDELGRAFGDDVQFIRFIQGERCIGWVVMLFADDVAYDLFHGIDYEVGREIDLYVNQLTEVIRLAIARGAFRLMLGQSTEIAKARFGATSIPLWIALRHRRAPVTRLLRSGRKVLFPQRQVPHHRVFK